MKSMEESTRKKCSVLICNGYIIAIFYVLWHTAMVSVEQSRPPSRFRGLVPDHPLPEPIADQQLSSEEQEAQRLQQELLRRYGLPGAVQQQVSFDSASRRAVEPNQIRAAMQGLSVPEASRRATRNEVAQVVQHAVIFIGEDDESRWPKGSVEDQFLQAEREMNKKKKKGA